MNKTEWNTLTGDLDIKAQNEREREFIETHEVGDKMPITVLIGSNDLIGFSGNAEPKELFETTGVITAQNIAGKRKKRLAIICPKYPRGINCGSLRGGLWFLAASSMFVDKTSRKTIRRHADRVRVVLKAAEADDVALMVDKGVASTKRLIRGILKKQKETGNDKINADQLAFSIDRLDRLIEVQRQIEGARYV